MCAHKCNWVRFEVLSAWTYADSHGLRKIVQYAQEAADAVAHSCAVHFHACSTVQQRIQRYDGCGTKVDVLWLELLA